MGIGKTRKEIILMIAGSTVVVIASLLSLNWHEYGHTVRWDLVYSLATFGSYYFAVWFERTSIIFTFTKKFFESESWNSQNQEVGHLMRQLATVSATFSSISIVTVSFIVGVDRLKMNDDTVIVGISMILASFILLAWGFALLSIASVKRPDSRFNIIGFKIGLSQMSIGVYLLFNGLLWSLSSIGVIFTKVSFGVYLLMFVSGIIGTVLLRKLK